MHIRDIMTTKLITVSSKDNIIKAEELMSQNKIRRLPVVDNGKLVGVISKDGIQNANLPSKSPIAIWKMAHYVYGMQVDEVMSKKLITVTPDTMVSNAVYLAQKEKVGCLPVIENNNLVGLVTTNDFFYKVLNPLLGVWQRGTRFIIHKPGDTTSINKVFECLNKHNAKILAIMYIDTRKSEEKDLVIRVETTENEQIEADLNNSGYNVEIVHLGYAPN